MAEHDRQNDNALKDLQQYDAQQSTAKQSDKKKKKSGQSDNKGR